MVRLQQIQTYQTIFWVLLFIVEIAYGRPPEIGTNTE